MGDIQGHSANPVTGSLQFSAAATPSASADRVELSPNVLQVRASSPDFRENTTDFNGNTYYYYRRGCFIKCPPSKLTADDKEAIRANFEEGHGQNRANLRIKYLLADLITTQLRGSKAHIIDVGCGEHPIFDFFEGNSDDISFSGVEQNKALLAKHNKMGNNVTSWATIMTDEQTYPANTPHIATSVYALGLMVNGNLGKRIAKVLGDEGQGSFYVGNFYLDSQEKKTGNARERLSGILERADLSYTRIVDPASRSNEFWVITHASEGSTNRDVSGILESKLQAETNGHTLKLAGSDSVDTVPSQPRIREHKPHTGGGVRRKLGRLQAG